MGALSLSLVQNGIDFVHHGIEEFYSRRSPNPSNYKYAIIHMFSGVLLLLKERLARIHPSLIFKIESELGQPAARTVDFHQTIRRLREHGVSLPASHLAMLEEIRQLRNEIEHYKVDLPLARAKDVIGELTAFAYWFAVDQLGVSVDDGISQQAMVRFYRLRAIGDRLLKEALESAAEDYAADDRLFATFGDQYQRMEPSAVLALIEASAESERTTPPIPCPNCDAPLLQLEVAVCLNPICRDWFRMDNCHSCMGLTFFGRYLCDSCSSG